MNILQRANMDYNGDIFALRTEIEDLILGAIVSIVLVGLFRGILLFVHGKGDVLSDLQVMAGFVAIAISHIQGWDLLRVIRLHKENMLHAIDFSNPKIVLAWKVITIFSFFELALIKLLPAPMVKGPITDTGFQPEYRDNGFKAFWTTMICFGLFSTQFAGTVLGDSSKGLYNMSIFYDNFQEIGFCLNFWALFFCVFLVIKGHLAPSGTDNNYSDNVIFEFYRGIELYPQLFGFDVKTFTNCRFGMMIWPVLICSYAAAQHNKYGYVANSMVACVFLMLTYVGKFYYWEAGYFRSIDIMHDSAAFYLVWGCQCFLPTLYTNSALYLVNNPVQQPIPIFILNICFGLGAILINYLADAQRQFVRETNGKIKLGFGPQWGQDPELLEARYTTTDGKKHKSLLLTNGYWGISRHFHYIPELSAAFAWCACGGFKHILPFAYFIFLCILLWDRASRDEIRLKEKYGSDYAKYCSIVRWKMIPGIY
jgi:7-dehydrocholesterol reductase